MKHFKNLTEAHITLGFPPPEHPLLSVMTCDTSSFKNDISYTCDFYLISYKKLKSGLIRYGRTQYDHGQGAMSFIKPRQLVDMRNIELEDNGFIICFHEDFLAGHRLHTDIKKYGFFDYESNEALHLSPTEEKTIWDLFWKIEKEYLSNRDEFSREIILAHIDSILKYSQRYYKRQFIDRKPLLGSTVSRFNGIVDKYFQNGTVNDMGLLSVNYIAGQLNLTPRYMSDLLKQETGKTAIELIHLALISEAKNLLLDSKLTVSEIAYRLGFENLPYFSRLFKKETGMTPKQFQVYDKN
jgi:AraC-like DNA-binding protein